LGDAVMAYWIMKSKSGKEEIEKGLGSAAKEVVRILKK
jgi:hypothetical protein